jgi:hypothetical protein
MAPKYVKKILESHTREKIRGKVFHKILKSASHSLSSRWYAAGKNISFQARMFCPVPEHFVPSVHFWPKSNPILINLPLNTVFWSARPIHFREIDYPLSDDTILFLIGL